MGSGDRRGLDGRPSGSSSRIAVAACCAALGAAALLASAAEAGVHSVDQAPTSADAARKGSLASARLQRAVDAVERGAGLPRGVQSTGGDSLVVEVLFEQGDGDAARTAILEGGGEPSGRVNGALIQASVPAAELAELERSEGVGFVRPPLDQSAPVNDGVRKAEIRRQLQRRATPGEEIGKTNASAWLAAGHRGTGIKVGVIDSFNQAKWNAARASGDVPNPSGTFCRFQGAPCDVWDGVEHGVAVSEIVHEMAPGAQIYIAGAFSAADHQAAVNYFKSQGVDIITRSLTGRYDGPGNGTGPMANVVNSAVNQGIAWFNSAGNSAGRGSEPGAYWRGQFSDGDGDGYIEFAPGDETLGFDCSFLNGLRWDDWGAANPTDYDLEIYVNNGGTLQKVSESVDDQSGGAPPLETSAGCANGVNFAAVKVFRPNNGTAGDVLEFMTNGSQTEHYQNPFSATGPVVESNSPGEISVGAVDPWNGTAIAGYSSEGPTNDGRIKPDLSAASCVSSVSYAPNCFNGTSAATPVAAGAAALVMGSGQGCQPAALKTYMLNATVDRGAAGTDNVFGRGEVRLPGAPPAGNPCGGGGGGDTTPPSVQAEASKGKQGKLAKLYFTVNDASNQIRDQIQIFSKGRLKGTINTVSHPSGNFYVEWKVPKKMKPKGAKFCVRSTDASGNSSGQSCAKLKVKKKKKKR